MYQPINSEGLHRLAQYELKKLNTKNHDEARSHLKSRFGPYDREGHILEKGLVTYYQLPN